MLYSQLPINIIIIIVAQQRHTTQTEFGVIVCRVVHSHDMCNFMLLPSLLFAQTIFMADWLI